MRAANVLVWMGDFNYRINIGYDEAKALIAEGKLDPLLLLVSSSWVVFVCYYRSCIGRHNFSVVFLNRSPRR